MSLFESDVTDQERADMRAKLRGELASKTPDNALKGLLLWHRAPQDAYLPSAKNGSGHINKRYDAISNIAKESTMFDVPLSSGANPNLVVDQYGRTAFQVAVNNDYNTIDDNKKSDTVFKTIQTFLDHGGNPDLGESKGERAFLSVRAHLEESLAGKLKQNAAGKQESEQKVANRNEMIGKIKDMLEKIEERWQKQNVQQAEHQPVQEAAAPAVQQAEPQPVQQAFVPAPKDSLQQRFMEAVVAAEKDPRKMAAAIALAEQLPKNAKGEYFIPSGASIKSDGKTQHFTNPDGSYGTSTPFAIEFPHDIKESFDSKMKLNLQDPKSMVVLASQQLHWGTPKSDLKSYGLAPEPLTMEKVNAAAAGHAAGKSGHEAGGAQRPPTSRGDVMNGFAAGLIDAGKNPERYANKGTLQQETPASVANPPASDRPHVPQHQGHVASPPPAPRPQTFTPPSTATPPIAPSVAHAPQGASRGNLLLEKAAELPLTPVNTHDAAQGQQPQQPKQQAHTAALTLAQQMKDMSVEKVKDWQQKLFDAGMQAGTHGLNHDGVDGKFGKDTKDAMEAACKKANVKLEDVLKGDPKAVGALDASLSNAKREIERGVDKVLETSIRAPSPAAMESMLGSFVPFATPNVKASGQGQGMGQ